MKFVYSLCIPCVCFRYGVMQSHTTHTHKKQENAAHLSYLNGCTKTIVSPTANGFFLSVVLVFLVEWRMRDSKGNHYTVPNTNIISQQNKSYP